jgi:hypothetical protein
MKAKIIVFVLIAGMLFGGSLVWAEGNYMTIKVFFDRINLTLNGQSLAIDKDSIVYNGTVYVPLRALSDSLGAQASWDEVNRSIALDFINTKSGIAFNASDKSLYQYIAIKNNLMMSQMIVQFKNNQVDKMKDQIDQYESMRLMALNINNDEMALIFDKLKFAAEMIRTGWNSKKLDDYYLAWNIFSTNEANLNAMLKEKLGENTAVSATP